MLIGAIAGAVIHAFWALRGLTRLGGDKKERLIQHHPAFVLFVIWMSAIHAGIGALIGAGLEAIL